MSTDFSLKNAPDFQSWRQDNLAKFAQDAYDKIIQQEDEIQFLRQDLKTAMEAYRSLLRKE